MFGRTKKQLPAKPKRKIPVKLAGKVSAQLGNFTLEYNFAKPVASKKPKRKARK